MIVVRISFWLAVWLGGLAFAGLRYTACRTDEGLLVPGCDTRPEYLGWAASILGIVMLARTLKSVPSLKRWFE
jgi:hypothetical protein